MVQDRCRIGSGPETERKLALEGQLLSQDHCSLACKFWFLLALGKGETVPAQCLGPPCPLGEGSGVCPSLLISALLLGLLTSCFFQLLFFQLCNFYLVPFFFDMVFYGFICFKRICNFLQEHCYDGCLKILVRRFQHLNYPDSSISWVYFLVKIVVILILVMTNNSLLYPRYLGFHVRKLQVLLHLFFLCIHEFVCLLLCAGDQNPGC